MAKSDSEGAADTGPEPGERCPDPRLLEILVCPVCRGPLKYDREAQELISRKARLAYPVKDGIPVMLVEEARALETPPPPKAGAKEA